MGTQNWDVPWAVGGGVQHSTNIGRVLAYAAFGGKEGIAKPRDLQVRQMAVPGTQVRVMPGACSVINRAADPDDTGPIESNEAYACRLPTTDEVDIAATGASGRSDMIVARVENPFINGQPYDPPADPQTGKYMFSRVISNVSGNAETIDDLPAAHRSSSLIPLARIDIPANTGTIEQSMIKDLRKLVAPRRETIKRIINLPDTANQDPLGSANFTVWPVQANWQVRIPEWAVLCQIDGLLSSTQAYDGDISGANWWGRLRIQHGNMFTQEVQVNLHAKPGTGQVDTAPTMAVGGDLVIPKDHRGTMRDLSFQGLRGGASGGMVWRTGWGTTVIINVTYYEAPDEQGWEN